MGNFFVVLWKYVTELSKRNDCGIIEGVIGRDGIYSLGRFGCFDNPRLCDSVCDSAVELGGSCDLNAGVRVRSRYG
jgi:hypothetical protein